MAFRLFMLLLLSLCFKTIQGQEFLLINSNRELIRANMEDCSRQFVSAVQIAGGGSISDITYTPDGRLWGITTDGRLFIITENTGESVLAHTLPNANAPFFTALVADEAGRIYAAGGNGGLYVFDTNTMEDTFLGNMGYGSAGDLTFYEGQLIMASTTNQMINVDINDPASSTVRLNFNAGGQIFGIVTFVEDCDNTVTYATNDTGSGTVFQVDFESNQLQQVCTLAMRIFGAASSLEFLAANPVVVDTVITTPTDCAISQGAIEVVAGGGNGALAYSLDGLSFQPSATFTGLSPGEYTIYIQDEEGCSATRMAVVENIGDAPALAVASVREDSCGLGVGAIEVEAAGGQPPYQYAINGGLPGSTPAFLGLSGGDYTVSVVDSQGCTDVQAITIPGRPGPQVERVGVQPCGAQQNSLTVDAGGGVGALTYRLNDGPGQLTPTFSALEAGPYLVTVIDEAGCSGSQSVDVPSVEPLAFTVADVAACGPGGSRLSIAAVGGTGRLTYRLDGGSFQNSGNFEGLSAGQYTVVVSDENGCTASFATSIPESDPLATVGFQSTPSRCGAATGTLQLEIAGGTAPFMYALDGREQTTPEFTGLAPGSYLLSVLDAEGCSTMDSVLVVQQCPAYFPSAFSPNDDGRNDRFELYSGADVDILSFLIFNRWGAMVYEQTDFNSADRFRYWDGFVGGEPAPAGVYAFWVKWVDGAGEEEFREGEVVLVR